MTQYNFIRMKYDNKTPNLNSNDYKIQVDIKEDYRKTDINIHLFLCRFKVITLFTEHFPNENRIKIVDIQNSKENRNQGYGTIVMNVLFEIGNILDVKKYNGWLSSEDLNDYNDPEHRDRLIHFYSKFGFNVNIENNRIEKLYE